MTGEETFPWISKTFKVPYHMLDIVSYGGNSGSPIVDYFGNVVGVLFGGYVGHHTEAFIVPLIELELFLLFRM